MGPQLYRCGNPPYSLPLVNPADCFNGAATLSLRKYVFKLFADGGLTSLQWGRNFIVAEILEFCFPETMRIWLQWGRNFIVAEIGAVGWNGIG